MENDTMTLYTKMAKIMGAVERIPKNGKNDHFKYSFATEGDISDAIRKLLSEHNIAVFSSMVRWTQNPIGNTIKTICDFEFTLACGDTGATHVCQWSAEANDNQDKGFNKTATAAMKYWLLKTFMIPTGEDPDSDGAPAPKAGKVSNAAPQQRPQQKAPAPQPQPQPSQPATPPAVNGKADADEARNAELRNEELVITKIEARSDSTGWYGYGMFNDGVGSHEVKVNLFAPEDIEKITEAGYQWVTSGKVQWPVVLKIDRNMARIDTVTPNQSVEPLETPSSAENGQPAIEPAWYATQAKDCWGVIKGWLLKNMYAKNAFHMKRSFHKHGITVDSNGQQLTPEWADSCAGDLIKYLEQNRELANAS